MPRPRRKQRDWGRLLAFVLCILFAVIGLVPLAAGALVRMPAVRTWAARETTNILENEIGVSARFEVEVQALPPAIILSNIVVDASDGGTPFAEVERARIRPRLFSLLAGELDVGDVEVEGPRIRVVVRDGKLANLDYHLPESNEDEPKSDRLPLASLTVTDLRVDADIEGVLVKANEVDLDLGVEPGGALEIALRIGPSSVTRLRPYPGRERIEDAVDDDAICRLDARVRVEDGDFLVRRLALSGSVDFDPDPATLPSCSLQEHDWRRVEVSLGGFAIDLGDDGLERAVGRARVVAPAGIAHRFAQLPHTTGRASLDVHLEYDKGPPAPKPEDGAPAAPIRLPVTSGTLELDYPGLDGKVFAKRIDAKLEVGPDQVELKDVVAAWGDGTVRIGSAVFKPFEKGMPLRAGPVDIEGVRLEGLLRDLGAHPQAYVGWLLETGHLETFGGTIDPLSLEGDIRVTTKDFGVYDRPARLFERQRMISHRGGKVSGTFRVQQEGVNLKNFVVETPGSRLQATVLIGFRNNLDVRIPQGSYVDLAELSPLVSVPVSGKMSIRASASGEFTDPGIEGDLSIQDFIFAGFDVGTVEEAHATFKPLALDLTNVWVRHRESRILAPKAHVAFDAGADVVVDADVDTRQSPHLRVSDFFHVFGFDKDPRFEGIEGIAAGTAKVHYAMGGPEDKCGGGLLEVEGNMTATELAVFGETYDRGDLAFKFKQDDARAGSDGMEINIQSAALRKGTGSILARATVRHGGVLRGQAVATGIPLKELDALGTLGTALDGTVSLTGELGGTLSGLAADFDVEISPLRIGPGVLPASRVRLQIEPHPTQGADLGETTCGNRVSAPFDQALYDLDHPSGLIRVNGLVAGGQIELRDVTISQQRQKVLAGTVATRELDLGVLANLVPGVAFAADPPSGKLTLTAEIEQLPVDAPERGQATVVVDELEVSRGGATVTMQSASGPFRLGADHLELPKLALLARGASGLSVELAASGSVKHVTSAPNLDVAIDIDTFDLARLAREIPAIERVSGQLGGKLTIKGRPSSLRYAGEIHLTKGELALKGLPVSMDNVNVDVAIGDGDIRLTRGTANVGGGTIDVTGRIPISGLSLGEGTATITARGVSAPLAHGIDLTADADLELTLPSSAEIFEEDRLPDLRGTVSLTSFRYERPIQLIKQYATQLTAGRARTVAEAYDPKKDALRFNINVVSPKPLFFENGLVKMKLVVAESGLVVSGTDQRFGARGGLRILPDSRLQLRNHEFEVREGTVRFDDTTKIVPVVDVRAETEYRRYQSSSDPAASETGGGRSSAPSASSTSAGGAGTAAVGNNWRILLHAYGTTDDLKLELTSDPALAQEDIVLLLTVGMTRAEIDRGLIGTLGETLGLEALSTLTGADKAIKTFVPILDSVSFGSSYSPRSGRSEPNITVGKRISDSVRANVTTGLTEPDVSTSIEWRLRRGISLQGSYDNVNDISSSGIGNIGADIRFRLEFE